MNAALMYAAVKMQFSRSSSRSARTQATMPHLQTPADVPSTAVHRAMINLQALRPSSRCAMCTIRANKTLTW
jgi:hypothetical protein